jgi:hypothetical protein
VPTPPPPRRPTPTPGFSPARSVPSFRPSAAYTFPLLHPPPPRTPGFHDPFLARVSGCNNAALSPSDKIQRVPDPIYVCSFQSIKPTPSLCRTPFRRSCPSGFPPGGQCFSVAAGGQRIVPPWFVPGALLLLLQRPRSSETLWSPHGSEASGPPTWFPTPLLLLPPPPSRFPPCSSCPSVGSCATPLPRKGPMVTLPIGMPSVCPPVPPKRLLRLLFFPPCLSSYLFTSFPFGMRR